MDIAAMNSHLEASYGPNRGALRPSAHEIALFFGDPVDGGVELSSAGGYARVPVDADTDWTPAANGEMATVWLQFPDTTDEYESTGTHWALIYDDGGDVLDDSGPLVDPLNVTGPGAGPMVRATVRFADSITPEEG